MKKYLLITGCTFLLAFKSLSQEARLVRLDASTENALSVELSLLGEDEADRIAAFRTFSDDNPGVFTLDTSEGLLRIQISREKSVALAKAFRVLRIETIEVSTEQGIEVMNFDQFAAHYSI